MKITVTSTGPMLDDDVEELEHMANSLRIRLEAIDERLREIEKK